MRVTSEACVAVRRVLPDVVDGLVAHTEVAPHVASCHGCHEFLATLEAIRALYAPRTPEAVAPRAAVAPLPPAVLASALALALLATLPSLATAATVVPEGRWRAQLATMQARSSEAWERLGARSHHVAAVAVQALRALTEPIGPDEKN